MLIHSILCMHKVSSGSLLSIDTFYSANELAADSEGPGLGSTVHAEPKGTFSLGTVHKMHSHTRFD